ncbi:transporter substrate-binding domain-containing protein [Calidifontibacter sp. DB0510]|uniref:Transporter substrate-binding domain-containing protein n=1 Tax=Metallococcus carri TaxID=1656884 RepID=A0A967EAC7_9MICO|nr:transporter substrate-binding domain-containing protein [Metallococcus carri]NHN56130.1 transporter substrate-binding domain-containing protein [Metallococcus carri]NOP37413.1 transporter substrate-binding domain-containing protein [Calidifontibacter sp. DB2511S]
MTSSRLTAALAPTGTLRAVINLGNPVLAGGTASDPTGVTVDLARELADRLGVPVAFTTVEAARDSFAALTAGEVDLAFLADEPARAAEVTFTAPYLLIEGVYAVPADSDLDHADDVDRPGNRVGVKEGSAYDLFLTRTLQHATIVRGSDGLEVFESARLEVAAGIRSAVQAQAERFDVRVLEPAFMQIAQAIAAPKTLPPVATSYLRAFVEHAKSTGFVADALRRAGQQATVAPPVTSPERRESS